MKPTTHLRRGIPRSTCTLMALAAFIVGCGSDSTGPSARPGSGSPVGRYALASIEGNALPYMYDKGPSSSGGEIRQYWLSGDVTFRSDSTFAMTLIGKTTGPGQSNTPKPLSWTGTWRLEPGGVELTSSSGKAHWSSSDQLGTLDAPGTFTKVSGGKGVLVLTFGKR